MLIELEKTVVELGINGPFIRLTPLKTIQDTLSSHNHKDAQTIIGVGGDALFFDLLDFACNRPLTLGMVALVPSPILRHLGISEGLSGCRTVAQRITKPIDCGKINQRYFFSQVSIPASYQISLDGRFQLQMDGSEQSIANDFFTVINIDFNRVQPPSTHSLRLEIIRKSKKLFRSENKNCGSFIFSTLKIFGAGDSPIIADGQKSFKPPVEISIAPGALKMIVGKNRHSLFQQ